MSGIVMGTVSVVAAVLLFELVDTVALISVDLSEERHPSLKVQMRDGDDVRGFGFRSADIQSAHDPPFIPHVEDACHVTAVGDIEIQSLLDQSPMSI